MATDLEKKLWDAADELRANSGLKANEYSVPVLGLLFLRFATVKFDDAARGLRERQSNRPLHKADYQAAGVLYLDEAARYATLSNLPEGENLAQAINTAMRHIEEENETLAGVLPKDFGRIPPAALTNLVRLFASIPMDLEGDVFGKIYEYFLGEFAKSEGQKGGEFFTPTTLVQLIVEIIEPFAGRVLDPACGSGGMFVQSARFVTEHRKNPDEVLSLYGQEKTRETQRLCRMNLAVHGLSGQVREGNSYYDTPFPAIYGSFDFVMANPPFNVDKVDKSLLKDDTRRFPFGMPSADNANYLWIQQFYSALSPTGRAGFVMANSASDARPELEIRRRLLEEARAVDVMVTIGSNFFYTVTLPCTLWFLDRGKAGTPRAATVLFIDARQIYHQVDRAHRDFTPDQIEFLANIVRLYRGEEPEFVHGSAELLREQFPAGRYHDVPGLCKAATLAEIAAQGYSLNPGRYVGVAARAADGFDFRERLEELNEEFVRLTVQAHDLEERIAANAVILLEDGERR